MSIFFGGSSKEDISDPHYREICGRISSLEGSVHRLHEQIQQLQYVIEGKFVEKVEKEKKKNLKYYIFDHMHDVVYEHETTENISEDELIRRLDLWVTEMHRADYRSFFGYQIKDLDEKQKSRYRRMKGSNDISSLECRICGYEQCKCNFAKLLEGG